MIKNYFKTAWRNLIRNKVFSIIAILGLAIGLAISILIFWGVNDEMTFDKSWSDAKNIYRLNATVKLGENTFDTWTGTPVPVAAYALENLPGVAAAVRYQMANNPLITFGDNHFIEKNAAYTEPAFFEMFHISFLHGNAKTALNDMKNVVLSRDAAVKYFGNVNNATGKILLINESQEPFTVSAVMENMPKKSSIRLDMLLSLDVVRKNFGGNGDWKTIDEDWGNFSSATFLRLNAGITPAILTKQLNKAHVQNNKYTKPGDINYILQPLNTIHLYNPDMSPGAISSLNLFTLIGILTLLISVINYVNLSTARATKRAKEVGLRRVVGADRKQLLLQFITEFVLIFIAALMITFLVLPVLIPLYQQISGKNYDIDYWQFSTLKIIGLIALGTISLASLYPAWILSSFNPIQVLKSNFNTKAKGGFLRKALVVIQFSFSIILIICTIVVAKQLHFIQTKNLGFNKENVFAVELNGKLSKQLPAITQELKTNKNISEVSFATDYILAMGSSTDGFTWPGKPENSTAHVNVMEVMANFPDMMQLKFVQGTGFTNTPADSGYFLVNESAVKEMSLKNPIGTPIELWGQKGEIKGILKDFNNKSLKENIQPAIFSINHSDWGGVLYVKTKAGTAKEAVAVTEKVFKVFGNIKPFEYQFLDDNFDAMYRREMQMASLFTFFAATAILLSCLGLFGLAVFTAERRTKEIGIRKVLGATVESISLLISKEFTWLVIIANIIAWPVAWYSMNKWMQAFAYKTEITWWIFFVAAFGALLLALLTIGTQAIKAALSNPVKSLRTE